MDGFGHFGGRLLGNEDRLGSSGGYYPYGEDRPVSGQQNPGDGAVSFATYTRDSATALNYADQRYYAAGWGRFVSADPDGDNWEAASPSTWNMYSYVEGDPIDLIDPTGLRSCADVQLTVNGVDEGTIGSYLAGNSDAAVFAETIYTESSGSISGNGLKEMSAIASVIMNRFQILNGYYRMFTARGSLIRPSPDWGPPGATISDIVFAPNQFVVWKSAYQLSSSAQRNLNSALSSDTTKDPTLCQAPSTAIYVAALYIAEEGTRTLYEVNGLVLTSFNSNVPPHSWATWEQRAASYESLNVFYGIPEDQVHYLPNGPVPLAPRPPARHHRRRH